MPILNCNGIQIAYETAGESKGPPILLIMGLGSPLTDWPDALIEGLVDLGFFVILFDNRDSGMSTQFGDAGTPSMALTWLKARVHWPIKIAYTVDDMADDALDLLTALGITRAHIVGASMGGMIAHTIAARHPERVRTLTTIMSTSGRRGLPGPSREAMAVLMRRPRGPKNSEAQIAHKVETFKVIGSPSYPTPERVLREQVTRSARRSPDTGGSKRQMAAVMAAGDRSELLTAIKTPALVIHGAADPLVPLACGEDTARLIPGARLHVIEGMGHDLPSQLIERLLALIDTHAHGKITFDSTARLFEKQ